jgi:outer membrane receptor protein involved in Fe transport
LAHSFVLHDPKQQRSLRPTPYAAGAFFPPLRIRLAALAAGLVLGWATQGHAGAAVTLDMPAQSLSLTLKRVARAGSVELAFDRAATDTLRAPRLKGRYTVDQALAAALAGTGLGVQRTSDGAYVVKPLSHPQRVKPVDTGDGAVSELLVLGRRNLNTGIRRTRNDIQPYDVALDETIHNAGDTDVEGFMRRAMPADAQSVSLSQSPAANSASARSRIDLLGLGSGQTLVLVDGRRLPSVPDAIGNGAGFVQADVNGIPLAAIERIEVLTAAAGALYGAGATGGVVNIILKRDYQGAEVGLTQGFTQHGGGLSRRVDASIGQSSSDGRSGLSVRVSVARNQGLDVGERLFGERALIANGGEFVSGVIPTPYVPVGAGVNVVSASGQLTLKPAYGGASLGSAYTSFSTSGFTTAEAVANAGKLDLELSPDAFGRKKSLTTRTFRRSVIVSARHETGIFEGFLDYLFLDNRGRATVPAGTTVLTVSSSSPENPFEQSVYVSRSVPWDGIVRNRSFTQRANAGLIVRLPKGWMTEGDLSWSRSSVRMVNGARGASADVGASTTIGGGVVGPDLSPFASQEAFLATYEAYRVAGGSSLKLDDGLGDLNVRASGPLWRLPGGPLTMTITAEASRERAPGGESSSYDLVTAKAKHTQGNRLTRDTRSAYAEWRAPLTSADTPGPLKGLTLQVALRADDYRLTGPRATFVVGGDTLLSDVESKHVVFAKTVGLKTFVHDGVMLRASYSEGQLPPRSDQIQPWVLTLDGYPRTDPRRDGQGLGWNGPFKWISGGSPDLVPEVARSFGLGVVLEPGALPGARLSIDYLRTEKSREIANLTSDSLGYLLARETLYPSRIVRAPLTDADRAKGFTVGAITLIDTSAMNIGRSIAETVDVSAEYRHALAGGEASAYLRGVWQPSYRRRMQPDAPWVEMVGYGDGPLRVRAFAGAQWARGDLSVGLNAQYYGSYRAQGSSLALYDITQYLAEKRGGHISPQTYFDAFALWSFGDMRRTQVRLIVRNLLDTAAPLALASATGYSTYGDAQGRGFELGLTRRF